MGQGDSRQACQGCAGQLEVGRQGSPALQLEGVGACQGGQEEDGEWAGLQGQQGAKTIPWGNAHPLG